MPSVEFPYNIGDTVYTGTVTSRLKYLECPHCASQIEDGEYEIITEVRKHRVVGLAKVEDKIQIKLSPPVWSHFDYDHWEDVDNVFVRNTPEEAQCDAEKMLEEYKDE